MPIHRPLWHRLADRTALPGLPCPRCPNGKLRVAANDLHITEPAYSAAYRDDPNWEPDNIVERWSATMRCDEVDCGEIVEMLGDTETVEVEVETTPGNLNWGLAEMLRIQAVYPPPPLFRIPATVPNRVRNQLLLTFKLYWTDTSACVARLRTAVEAMLDDQDVPRERKIEKTGKMHRMNLEERINAFVNGAQHKDELQGLRNIGNLGTHGSDDVDAEDLFDAIDVFEFVLRSIYETETLKGKAKKLAEKKHGKWGV